MDLYSNTYSRSYMFDVPNDKVDPYLHLQGHVYFMQKEITISLGKKTRLNSGCWSNVWRVIIPADEAMTMDAVRTLIDFPVEYREYVNQVLQMFHHLKITYGKLQ